MIRRVSRFPALLTRQRSATFAAALSFAFPFSLLALTRRDGSDVH